MSGLVVTGFASLDYAVALDGMAGGDRTTLIRGREPGAWPRLGGCPAYVAAEAARHGVSVAPLSWVGTDAEGDLYCDRLAQSGADVSGIARVPASRSPVSLLVYQADGSCMCLYDPAFAGSETLSAHQRALIAGADHLCVTVGPPHLASEILAQRRDDAMLHWVLKNDPACFPEDVRKEVARRADVIFRNRSERDLVPEMADGAVIVETDGTRGVSVLRGGGETRLEVEAVDVVDTTGAGDTLAGGYIAALMNGETDPVAAARRGIAAVRALLEDRARREEGEP